MLSGPKEKDCPSHDELRAFSLAKISEAALESISSHLHTCEVCLSTLVAMEDGDDSLIQGLRSPSIGEEFLDEPEYHQTIEKLEVIGAEPAIEGAAGEVSRENVPEVLGRYRILEELGRGGMGTVYLAHDAQLDREVALKIPHFRPHAHPRLVERFYREARVAATIEHPNLCRVYDVGEIDGLPYLSMALIHGKSLSKVLRSRGPLPQQDAAELVQKLATAAQEAHARGIVHRDIKPSNIMVTDEGEPILTDFGLARRVEVSDTRLTHSGLIVGTPSYMAPEQVDGDPETLSPRCDIYSLGVVLYELLTDRVPFRGSLLSVLSKLGTERPDPPSAHRADVDARLEAICLKAMAKEPADRYESAATMAEALEEFLSGSSPAARPPLRRRWLAWGSAVAAAALFVCAGVFIYVNTGSGTLVLEVNEPDVTVTIDGEQVHIKSPRDEITVTVGRHDLEVRKGGFETHTESFRVWRGGRVEIAARLEPAPRITTPRVDLEPGSTIRLNFDSPVPGTIQDKDSLGTGFTHRLPGTGRSLPRHDPNLDLSSHPGFLTITSTGANLSFTEHRNLAGMEAIGLYLPDVGNRDVRISAKFKSIHLAGWSDQLLLIAGTSVDQHVHAGLHQGDRAGPHLDRMLIWEYSDGSRGFPHYAASGHTYQEFDNYCITNRLVGPANGDDIIFTLGRTAGKWWIAWDNLSEDKYSDGYTRDGSLEETRWAVELPDAQAGVDLYVGLLYANPRTNTPQTTQVDWFEVQVAPRVGQQSAASPATATAPGGISVSEEHVPLRTFRPHSGGDGEARIARIEKETNVQLEKLLRICGDRRPKRTGGGGKPALKMVLP